jgi:hypothetical protein
MEQLSLEILLHIISYLPNWIKLSQLSKHYLNIIENNKKFISFGILKSFKYNIDLDNAYIMYNYIIQYRYKKNLFKKNPDCNKILQLASQKGNTLIVKLMLADTRVNPAIYNNNAISLAAHNSHLKIVELLCKDPRVDPSDNCNIALQVSLFYNNKKIIKILLSDPRVMLKSIYDKNI